MSDSPWANGHSIDVLREVASGIVPSVQDFVATPVSLEVAGAVNVDAEWVIATGVAKDAPIALYFHGGAHLCGHPAQYRNATVGLSRAAGVRVLVPDYRLAPEHPFPAGFDDAMTSYEWLLKNAGVAPSNLAIAGDSAGAALAVTLAADAKAANVPLPGCILANSPFVDLSLASESLDRPELNVNEPNKTTVQWLADTYLRAGNQSLSPTDPRHSPIYRNLTGLPPLLVQTAGLDNLQSDGARLAEHARLNGVETQHSDYAESAHIWTVFASAAADPEANRALEEMADFIRSHC